MDKKIGQLIKDKVKASKMAVTEFASAIGVERSNVYYIFQRDSIDTKMLKKIGHVLNYDFFQDLLEEDTVRNLVIRNRIEDVVYVPIHLTKEELNSMSIKDRVLENLLKK